MLSFDDYRCRDATALAQGIAAGDFSREEVWQAALARLDAVNPTLNLLAQDWRHTLAAQAAQAPGSGPLAGVPLLLKDLIADVAGQPTGSGNRILAGIQAAADSDLVAAYRRAGLLFLGRSTTPEFGVMPYTESHRHGATRNPWSPAHSPGGSSGGAAAAVAAQVVPLAHGGDGGGSIRIPASHCGLFGLKPSRGRSSLGPLLAEAWQGLVCEHVLSRSVRDSAAMLDIAASARAAAPLYHCPVPTQSFTDSLQQPLPRLRIAVSDEPWLGGRCDEAVLAAHKHTVALLQRLGHHIETARPAFADAERLGRAMLVTVAGEMAMLRRQWARFCGRPMRHSDVEPGTWALMVYGEHISAGEALEARALMLAQAHIAADFHRRYDVLCTPVLPSLPPLVGELAPAAAEERSARLLLGQLNLGRFVRRNPILEQNHEHIMHQVSFTAPFNMSGQPAMSVPLYWHRDYLPVGSQFVAAHGQEALLLQLAQELEQAQPWFMRTPPECAAAA